MMKDITTRNILSMFVWVLILTGASLGAARAAATESTVPPLTEESIRSLYDEAIRVFKTDMMTYKMFLQRSMHETYVSNTLTTIEIPGQQAAAQQQKSRKADALDNAEQTFKGMKDAKFSHKITSIILAPDGMSAIVKDTKRLSNLMISGIPTLGSGKCDDEVVATPIGPQIIASNCKMEMLVQLPQ